MCAEKNYSPSIFYSLLQSVFKCYVHIYIYSAGVSSLQALFYFFLFAIQQVMCTFIKISAFVFSITFFFLSLHSMSFLASLSRHVFFIFLFDLFFPSISTRSLCYNIFPIYFNMMISLNIHAHTYRLTWNFLPRRICFFYHLSNL